MRELQIQYCSMLRNLSKFSSFINANFSLSLNILTNQGKKYRIRSTNSLSLNLLSTWITINLHKEDFNSTIELRGFNCIRVHAHDSRLILSRSRWWFYEEVDIRPWPMLCVSLVSEWMHVRREWTAPSVITLHVNSRSSSFRSTRRTSPGTWHVCAVISPTIEEQAKHIRSSSFVGLRIHTVSKIDECWMFLTDSEEI